jgi:dinuclear metal center YbgI/SA1388 family protein
MTIAEIISFLESVAPPSLQESYDNSGLLLGNETWECSGAMVSLDTTEAVIAEAVEKKCNLIISHHPIIFSGLKKIREKNWLEQTVIAAIKANIAIYAIHTNLDNVLHGVNAGIADQLGLINRRILAPRAGTLEKLFVYVPLGHAEAVRNAIFMAGGGHIGNYSECSFSSEGIGTFSAGDGAHPFAGKPGKRHSEPELRIEVVFPAAKRKQILEPMIRAHPYEEVAYDIISLANPQAEIGSGMIAELTEPTNEDQFLNRLKAIFNIPVIRHSSLNGRLVQKIALCGGAGSFLIPNALDAGADFYITSDLKYHEFFQAEGRLVLADIGHYESEQFTVDLLIEILSKKYPTFAVQKTTGITNPVRYFL